MKKIFLTMALAVGLMATAQVKIGTNVENINPASILELESSTQGVNFPKLALTSTTVAAPLLGDAHVAGMTVYNTNTIGDVTPGMYTNSGTAWVKLGAATVAPLNVTTEKTLSYIASPTDDIILMTPADGATITLTLPTSGINIGKKFYISIMGNGSVTPSPLPREGITQTLYGTVGYTLMYVGGTGNNSYSVISGQ